jgi:very-short-patch-repair endonuclease
MTRPHRNASVVELEALVAEHSEHPDILRQILGELHHRSVPRAERLARRISERLDAVDGHESPNEQLLNGNAVMSTEEGRPTQPYPADAPLPTWPTSEPTTDGRPLHATQLGTAPSWSSDDATIEAQGSQEHVPASKTPNDALARVRQIFRFLKEFAVSAAAPATTLNGYPWRLRLHDLPSHQAIAMRSRVLTGNSREPETDHGASQDAILVVARPTLTPAPKVPGAYVEWVDGATDDPTRHPTVLDRLRRKRRGDERTGDPAVDSAPVEELLTDDATRVAVLQGWAATREVWAAAELPAWQAMEVFQRLYALLGRIDRESEKVELILGNGVLRSGQVAHPVLLQRVELVFDPTVPAFRVVDADRGPELYTPALEGGEGVTGERLQALREELESGGFHPFDLGATEGFLRRVMSWFGPDLQYVPAHQERPLGTPTVDDDPVLFLRNRSSGLAQAFEWVLDDLDHEPLVPSALVRISGFDTTTPDNEHADSAITEDVSLAASIGEPDDVLFAKPANLEQVRIARALEKHGAVLVQGPPGTGKSHTIANLVGHLVANGQRVLVTSHTTKALGVLRGHLPKTLQPLCVAMLEQDLEGRAQLEDAVRGIVERVTGVEEHALAQEVQNLTSQRQQILANMSSTVEQLRSARAGEYEPVIVAGESLLPAAATQEVLAAGDRFAWIPSPVVRGAPLPLDDDELAALYESNGLLSGHDESALGLALPSLDAVADITRVRQWVTQISAPQAPLLRGAWSRPLTTHDQAGMTSVVTAVDELTSDIARMEPWQQAIVEAGRLGGADRDAWETLAQQCRAMIAKWQSTQGVLLAHAVDVNDVALQGDADLARALSELEKHVSGGGSLSKMSLMFKRPWRDALEMVRVDGGAPKSSNDLHVARVWIERQGLRRSVGARWDRQSAAIGLPSWGQLGTDPERTLGDYVEAFVQLLDWWAHRWTPIARAFDDLGFQWETYRSQAVAKIAPQSAFRRDLQILSGSLLEELRAQEALVDRDAATVALAAQRAELQPYAATLAQELLAALDAHDLDRWATARDALSALHAKSAPWRRRRELLAKLEMSAPGWSSSLRHRDGVHGKSAVPADVRHAWRWRQLSEELEYRARLDERALAKHLERLRQDLRHATQLLIDRKAWLAQLRRTDHAARQALIGWSDTQAKIGKGTGVRAPELQAEARKLLAKARSAVPVWIMPLARVAESFDPRQGKFDVVIVDEASQSDVAGLLAFYLGKRVVVVGDHEQVSPSAVGQNLAEVSALIQRHLAGVPNSHLYDGRTSIYDLARQSFGGVLALSEHFRCVPDIIEFSNNLSYRGMMRPLRDPSTAIMPHVVEYVVGGAGGTVDRRKGDLVNDAEARTTAALVAAMMEHPAYRSATFGAISLVGEEQAREIEKYLLSLVPAERLLQRRFAVGTPAQFQGDERDVMLLSMVDVPKGDGARLRIREEQMFKQRFNVAASRARNQMWLVHSLEPARDLQENDLRRRLIEHVRDPNGMRRALEASLVRAESPFEKEVMTRLIQRGYRLTPQVEAGRYRIDMVISDDTNQVALECDGDRFHPPEQIPADLARQAVLERAGWRFIRLRGTRFYRDPDGSMDWVFEELARLDIRPMGAAAAGPPSSSGGETLRDEVVRQAWDIMHRQGWLPNSQTQVEVPQ